VAILQTLSPAVPGHALDHTRANAEICGLILKIRKSAMGGKGKFSTGYAPTYPQVIQGKFAFGAFFDIFLHNVWITGNAQ
jgi:hypothetical protein